MTLQGFGPRETQRTIAEITYPPESGRYGIFSWPKPLLQTPNKYKSSTNPIEAFMAVYSPNEMRYIVASIISRAAPVKFVRTTTTSELDEAIKAWETLIRDTRTGAGQYNLGTNINMQCEDTDKLLRDTNVPLFQIITADEAGSGKITVRGYDAGRVRSALEILKRYIISPFEDHQWQGGDEVAVLEAIAKNGHSVTPRP